MDQQAHRKEIEVPKQGTGLVVYSGPDVWSGPTQEEFSDLHELEAKVEKARGVRTKLQEVLFEFRASVENSSLVKPRLSNLRTKSLKAAELEMELDELRRSTYAETDDFDFEEEDSTGDNGSNGVDQEEKDDDGRVGAASGPSRNHKRLCKSLYAKIAARTHPDKTSDKDLNELFVLAKKAYDRLDFDDLEEIWDALKGGNPLRSRLSKTLVKLREELARIETDLANLMHSDMGQLLQLSKRRGFHSACFEFRHAIGVQEASLDVTILALKNQIQRIRDEVQARSEAADLEEINEVRTLALSSPGVEEDDSDTISFEDACK